MLSSALFYSPPGRCHARTARLLAACCAGQGQRGAALEYLSQAGRHEPPGGAGCAVGKLLELRVLLALMSNQQQGAGAATASSEAAVELRGGDGGRECEEAGGEEDGGLWRRVCKLVESLPAAAAAGAGGSGAPHVMQVGSSPMVRTGRLLACFFTGVTAARCAESRWMTREQRIYDNQHQHAWH
jgi:hypothetical protein